MFRIFSVLVACVFTLACSRDANLPYTAPGGGEAPEITVGADGRAYLSWIESAPGEQVLRFAVFEGAGWSAPRAVVRGNDLLVNWADFPSVTALGDGTLAAHWLRLSPVHPHAYDAVMALSRDGGLTWGAPFTLHDDGTATEHGFVTLVPWGRDRVMALWLDGRAMEGLPMEEAEARAAMSLRFAELASDGTVIQAGELDDRTCSCCQTSAVAAGEELLAVYRDRSAIEIRDIFLVRRQGSEWTAPEAVAGDGWQIDACPVNGPSVDAREGAAAVAWFTGAGEDPRVQVAFLPAGGGAPGAPMRVDSGKAIGRVDVVLADRDTALVSWLELDGSQARLQLRRVHADGRMDMPETLVRVDPSRVSGFPRMVRTAQHVVVVWTRVDEQSRRVEATIMPLPRG